MSILTVVQDVAEQTGLIDSPSSVIGNTTKEVVNALALANKVGRDVSRSHNWGALLKVGTFTTSASDPDYSVASDYDRLVYNTLWDSSNNEPLVLTTDQTTAYIANGIVSPVAIRKYFRIKQGKFYFEPAPTTADTIVYDYVTNKWAVDSGGSTTATSFTADTDTTLFPEYLLELGLIWRLRKRYGGNYADDLEDYNDELKKAIGRDRGATVLYGAPTAFQPTYNIQDGNFPS